MGEGNSLHDSPGEQESSCFFELSRELLAVLGADGRILQANPAWGEVVGTPPDTLKGARIQDFIHPDARQSMETPLGPQRGVPGHVEFSCRWRSGARTWRWLSLRGRSSREGGRLA